MDIDNDPLTLEEWLVSTAEIRAKLVKYGKEPLPSDAGQRHLDLDTAIQNSEECGNLLADAESYLIQHLAQATLSAKTDFPSFTGDERKIFAKNAVKEIQRLVDGISVAGRAIRDRIYVGMNANRAGR
jgi:hypothetical protein